MAEEKLIPKEEEEKDPGKGKGGEKMEEEEKEEILDDSTYEPPVRKTVADYVAERRGKKIEKLQKKEDEEGFEEEPDEIGEKIKSVVEGYLNPVFDSIRNSSDDSEINSFLAKPENSHFKKYEKLARKEAIVYQNVPIEKIFRSLAFDHAQILVDDKSEKAKEEAKKGKVGGSVARQSSTNLPDFSAMSMKDVQKLNQQILAGKKIKLEE